MIEKLSGGEGAAAPAARLAPVAAPSGPAALQPPATFRELVATIEANGKPHLAQQLHDFVGIVRYAPPELVVRPLKALPGDFMRELAAALKAMTGTVWTIQASNEEAEPSLLEQEKGEADKLRQAVLESPTVKAAFEAFPDAELIHFSSDQRSA